MLPLDVLDCIKPSSQRHCLPLLLPFGCSFPPFHLPNRISCLPPPLPSLLLQRRSSRNSRARRAVPRPHRHPHQQRRLHNTTNIPFHSNRRRAGRSQRALAEATPWIVDRDIMELNYTATVALTKVGGFIGSKFNETLSQMLVYL